MPFLSSGPCKGGYIHVVHLNFKAWYVVKPMLLHYFSRFPCRCRNFHKTSIVCHHFIALVLLFRGHFPCQNFLPLTGPYHQLTIISTCWRCAAISISRILRLWCCSSILCSTRFCPCLSTGGFTDAITSSWSLETNYQLMHLCTTYSQNVTLHEKRPPSPQQWTEEADVIFYLEGAIDTHWEEGFLANYLLYSNRISPLYQVEDDFSVQSQSSETIFCVRRDSLILWWEVLCRWLV